MRHIAAIVAIIALLLSGATPSAQASEPTWRLKQPAQASELTGYSAGESITPGQPLKLLVDGTGSSVRVDIFRMGDYGGKGGLLIRQLPQQPLKRQPACPVSKRTVDCTNWQVTHTVDTTGWEPGVYFSKLTDNLGRDRYVPTILRSTDFSGKVALMSATFTHAAYNTTGGYSLYLGGDPMNGLDRAYTVSTERPDRGNGADKIFRYELGLIQFLESLGVPLAYTTNAELHRGADGYAGARALVTLGHDEYWTVPMRDNLQRVRDRGTNLLFLGSNTMYYRTRWDGTSKVTSYKLSELDPDQTKESTGTFRSDPFPDPEARLLGSQYDCDGANPQTDLVIMNPDFWAFAGTGAKTGSRYPSLVGHEVDKAGPDSPPSVHIAAHSSFQCTKRQGWSDITYYVAPSKAGVLNLGTMGFAYALTPGIEYPAKSVKFAKHVLANMLREAAVGPLGNRHTAPANYRQVYPLPPVQDHYITPGYHDVNGRRWHTTCEPYSSTERCRTNIWATTVSQQGGRFVVSNDWAFNNLTYKPMARALWKGNPLAANKEWTAADGRRWRTECDTAATGRNGCRSYLWATAIATHKTATGANTYRWENAWRFNSMVRFS